MSRRSSGPGRGQRPGSAARHTARAAARVPYARRPFADWPGEADLVAMREVVPSATAPLHLLFGDRPLTLATVLPMSWSAMVRPDGSIVLALQTAARSGDLDRDLGQALESALRRDDAAGITGLPLPTEQTPGLRSLVEARPLEVTVHSGFDWWLQGAEDALDGDVAASLEQANASVVPTVRLQSVPAAYWCRIGERCHLRWAMAADEDTILEGLARLQVRRELALADGSRYIGAFRAQGIVVPVWDVPTTDGEELNYLERAAAGFQEKLQAAAAETSPLTPDERRAKAGVISRQLTLR